MATFLVSPPSPTFERNASLFPRFESYERTINVSSEEEEEDELARMRMKRSSREMLRSISELEEWDGRTIRVRTTRRERTRSAPVGKPTSSARRKSHVPEPPSWHSHPSRSYSYAPIAGRRRSVPPSTSSSHTSLPDLWSSTGLEKLPVNPAAALQKATEAFQVGLVALLGAAALWTLVGVLFASYGLTAIDSLGSATHKVQRWTGGITPKRSASSAQLSPPSSPSSKHPPRPPFASLLQGALFTLLVAIADHFTGSR